MKTSDPKFRTVLGLLLIIGVMTGLTSYSSTLYKMFCDFTGYGGTTQRAEVSSDTILERMIRVRFNADVNSALDWEFRPVQKETKIRVGEKALAFYLARSTAEKPITGTATFNVTPAKAGKYFVKTECFCFTEQTLAAGEAIDMPVQFYIDPEIAQDRNLDDVDTITLSYTFFRSAKTGEDEKYDKISASITSTSSHNKIN
ncbi:MAG: cytochrome c oxidase assembly protein [Pseudomonadota bacterium]|nr:cytochrome c oxidase assembly protein [Pseudomonadota bacterium]